jgi:tetratricopeptide (TPR) repeat protein/type II secretory pathway predicted ATPase ExeA
LKSTSPDLLPSRPASTPPPFIGRAREIALLQGELEGSLAGRGRIVLVAGEPGVGKTWLVREALAQTQKRVEDLDARWARCSDVVGAPAFWAWRQLLGPSLELAGGRLDAASEVERFEQLHRGIEQLREASRTRPLVLVIDDLQWADGESVTLLDFLAHEIGDWPLCVVATLRDVGTQNDASREIEALARHKEVRRIQLAGWSAPETRRYFEIGLGTALDSEVVDGLQRVTAGNPYFADELIRGLTATEILDLADGTSRPELPIRIEQIIAQRLAACNAATRELLELAAVAGPTFTPALIGKLGDPEAEPAEHPLSVIDRAVAARLLEPADVPGRFRFVHGLVPSAILARMSAVRRSTLHGRLGMLLERESGLGATGSIAELARHFASAAALPEFASRALHYSRIAGDEAAAQHSYALAAQHYREALAALASLDEPARDGRCERAELLASLGQCLALRGTPDAQDVLQEAESIARAGLASDERDRATRVLARALLIQCEELPPATPESCRALLARAEEALAALGPDTDLLRARLLAALTPLHRFDSDRARPAARAREALALAAETDDPTAQGRALEALHWALLDGPAAVERLEIASSVLAQAERAQSARLIFTARFWRYLDLLELGRAADAEAELGMLEALAAELSDPRRRHQALYLRAGFELARGELARAEALAQEALELGLRSGVQLARFFYLPAMIQIAFLRGDAERLANWNRESEQMRSQHPQAATASSVLLAWLGREASAAEDFEAVARRGFDRIPRGPDWLATLNSLAWTAIELGQADICRELYELLRDHAGRFVVYSLGATTSSVDRVLGKLAMKQGHYAAAAAHFEAGIEQCVRSGARADLVWLHLERAELRIAQGAQASNDEVVQGLRTALALAREIGAPMIERRVRIHHPTLAVVPILQSPCAGQGLFIRRGSHWQIALGDGACELADSRGLQLIATLLARPGEPICSTELVAQLTGETDVPLERARIRVTQRIRSVVEKLRRQQPTVAAHLANFLHTGNDCGYLPRAEDRIEWILTDADAAQR